MSRSIRLASIMLSLSCGIVLPPAVVDSADWPQWQGPNRNGVSPETGLRTEFPQDFRPTWTFDDCGVGYSAPAVVGGRAYLLGATQRDDQGYEEFAVAIDANGRQIWKTIAARYSKNIILPNWGHGPRGTPAIADGKLFGIGANGDLFAIDAATGELVWTLNLRDDLGGAMMGLKVSWGYSESPLIDGDRVVCTPGGKEGTVASIDSKTGALVWHSMGLTDPAAYSSLVSASLGGVPQYVVLTAKHVAGIRSTDGQLLWQIEVPLASTAVITTPIVTQREVYVTSDYGTGCSLIRVAEDAGQFVAETVYSNKVMANHHGGVVLVDGHVYGWTGKTNARGRWICQDLATGEERWSEEKAAPAGAPVTAGGHLYCYTQDEGELVCAQASPKGWLATGRFTVPERTTLRSPLGQVWTHPVIAGGRLFLRDQNLLFCYDLEDSRRKP